MGHGGNFVGVNKKGKSLLVYRAYQKSNYTFFYI